MKLVYLFIIACAIFPVKSYATTLPEDKSKAVILAYHRIGEDTYPATNLRTEQFLSHINEIRNNAYNIQPLPEILRAIKNKTPLPPRTIAITFEGGYNSAWRNAIPILLKAKIPITMFYNPDKASQNHPGYMSWKTLEQLSKNKNITLAITSNTPYDLKSLNKARATHRKHFSKEVDYIAIAPNQDRSLLQKQGFKAAFGLHSGTVFPGANLYALPRFSITEAYGDLERFQLITNTLPLPISDMEPKNLDTIERPLSVGFTLPKPLKNSTNKLSCFLSGHSKPIIEKLGRRIEIRESTPDARKNHAPKMRLNCIIEEATERGETPRWRWLGMMFQYK